MKAMKSHLFAFISLLLLLSFQIAPSEARILANHNQNVSANSGRWSTELGTATGTGSATSYQITWTGNSNKQYELISFINQGNFDLVAEHLTFSSAKSNGDTTNPPTLTFELCSENWDTTTFACSGTITLIGTATGGSINFNRYLIVGQRLIFRVTNARNAIGNQISTFNSQSFRSDIRYGISTSS